MAAEFLVTLAVNFALSYWTARLTAPDGPQLSDLNIIRGDYGVPMPRIWGRRVRVGGTVIASDGLTAHEEEQDNDLLDGLMGGLTGLLIPAPTLTRYTTTVAVLIADRTHDGPIAGVVKILANGKAIYDGYGGETRHFSSLRVYDGSFTQMPDPALLSLGLIDGEAYRGTAYVVIENLRLEDFGNQLPKLEFIVEAREGQTLADIVEIVCEAAGIDSATSISTTGISDIAIEGFAIQQEVKCWDAIQPLLPAYACDAAEVAGQLRFFKREQYMRAVIPATDMGAHAFGDDPPEAYRFSHGPDIGLPQQVVVTFRDPERDLQTNTQSARRTEGDAASNISVQYALTLSASAGRAMAERLLWEPWTGRTTDSFTLTDKWIGLTPGVVYGVGTPVGIRAFRTQRRSRGANGLIVGDFLSDESVVYGATAPGESGEVPDNPAPDPVTEVPGAPTGLFATGGFGSALVSWADNPESDAVTSYLVYRATGLGAAFGTALLIGSSGVAAYGDAGLGDAADYTYFVKAVNIIGASLPSVGVDVTTNDADEADAALRLPDLSFFLLPDGGHLIVGV